MSIVQHLLRNLPGLSPQWRRMISQAWEITRGYQNSRSDLLRAIADRNLSLGDLEKGLPYLQSGPVAGMLDALSPGLSARLYALGSEVARSGSPAPAAAERTPSGPSEGFSSGAGTRPAQCQSGRKNPFPALKP